MLNEIAERLGNRVQSTWVDEMTTWGARVKLYRDYYDGEHRAKMSDAMRKMLNISDARTENFNANYCGMVVDIMTDRLRVNAVEGDNKVASAWAAEVLDRNRFDGLQISIHEAAVRDGDTFLLVTADPDNGNLVVMAHEPAWDGDTGMLVVYDRTRTRLEVAIKVWREADVRYVNLYWADRIEKFVWGNGGSLAAREDALEPLEWRLGEVPVVHFRNRARAWQTLSISELAATIPLQDALNRTMVSMIMTAELTGFGMRYAKGFAPEQGLAPGVVIIIDEDSADAALLGAKEIGLIEQADLMPFINQAQFIIDQIGTVTRTPLPGFMGDDDQSGEALKQRETFLLGKVAKFQVQNGNTWEDALGLAARIQATFGTEKAPVEAQWQCRWEDAQTRNDTEVIDNALKVADKVWEMETLRLLAPVFGWDEKKIKMLLREKREQAAANLAMIGLPGADRLRNAGGVDDEEDDPAEGDRGQKDAAA